MFKNYFYLFRSIKDLSPIIIGKKITEVYTQEKDKLYFNIPSSDNEYFHLIINTSPQLPHISLRDNHHKAKKNVRSFFDDFLPDKIKNIEIALGDRIIKISLCNSCFYFSIRGGETNVFLIDKNQDISSFKKVDDDKIQKIKNELLNTKFINNLEVIYSLIKEKSEDEIRKDFKFIDKDIIRECDKRGDDFKMNLIKVLGEIYNSNISVFLDENKPKPFFIPYDFINNNDKENYGDYFSAINKYFIMFYSIGKDKLLRNELEKYIEKELERTSNKLNNLKSRIDAGSKDEQLFYSATLLLSSIHSITKGMKEIEIEDYSDGNNKKIHLDEKLSPQQNIDELFNKARSEKINYVKSKELFNNLEQQYHKLLNTQKRVSETSDFEELIKIKRELKINMDTQKHNSDNDRIFNFRHYLIDSKYHLFVGRDSKNNDLLTTKFAKQNDFWFHARSVSGSHAVLRIENTKEAVPKNIIKKAASIAAFYSKAKTSKLASVSYTFKKYVVKKKDLDPGQVILLKEQVLLVPPEIPVGCEMISDE